MNIIDIQLFKCDLPITKNSLYSYYPNPYKQLSKVIIITNLQKIKPEAHKR